MNRILILIAVVALGVGVYFYATRPVAAPTEITQTPEQSLPTTENDTEHRYVVSGEKSKAEFRLEETLRGKRTTVVGTTNNISGEIVVDTKTPVTITFGEVRVNARTLKTDSEQRNGAIGRFILKSEESANEYIVFKTTSVTGVPNTIEEGKEFDFKITGDLTIRGTTKQVTFDATGVIKADSFEGKATTTVVYADFGLSIPSVPFVAEVDKTTKLTVTFVADER